MRLSTVILPVYRWPEARAVWRAAEELGFHTAYTYDHLWWKDFRDGPWFGQQAPAQQACLPLVGRAVGQHEGVLRADRAQQQPVAAAARRPGPAHQ